MPYIPDLIPDESKVIPGYFKYQALPGTKQKPAVGQIFMAVLFLGIAIYLIDYFLLAVLFGLLAASCTPAGTRWLERKGRFELTLYARSVIYILVLVLSIPIYGAYQSHDRTIAAERESARKKALQFSTDSLKADSNRRQKLFALLAQAHETKPDNALKICSAADSLAKTQMEKDSVKAIYEIIQMHVIEHGLTAKTYNQALVIAKQLLVADPRKAVLWYCRARCYAGLDSMQMAVNDLDTAKALGYKPAAKLFERLNPVKRHIVGYCTLCSDGTTSDATGHGACSWHGGVAEWDHPIYETYRKYGD